MTKEDEQFLEKVKFILNAGDKATIHTMKVTIDAYIHYIKAKNKEIELIKKKAALEKTLEKQKGSH